MIKLSEKEQVILGAVENRARASISSIAKLTGLKEHAVRYHLQYLIEKGVILNRVPLIDASLLGYTDFSIYFTLTTRGHELGQAMLDAIALSEGVVWFAEIGGEFEYGMQVSVRSVRQVQALFNVWSRTYKDPIRSKSIAAVLRFSIFGRKYLGRFEPQTIEYGMSDTGGKYDAVDQRILSGMTSGKYDSDRELARFLGMPSATLARRVLALEKSKVIAGYIYRIDPEKLGRQRLKLQIFTTGVSVEFNQAFYKFCSKHPNVVTLIEFLGPWDFELGIEVASQDEYQKLHREILKCFGTHIASIISFPFFRSAHFTTYPYRFKATR